MRIINMYFFTMIHRAIFGCCITIFFLIIAHSTFAQQPATTALPRFDLSPGKKVVLNDSVFRKGSFSIERASLLDLAQLARYIQARPDLEFEIRGHASNEGPPERNMLLSKQRADAAKEFLVKNFSIPAARIRASGAGDSEPLVPNTDEEARARNRRVEFIGLSGITQRQLTTVDNKAIEGDGYISFLQNSVRAKAPWDDEFQNAYLKMPIYENHRIETKSNSRVEITFRDNTKIQIGENTVVVVYSPAKNRSKDKPQETVELVKGDLLMKLQGKNANNAFSVRTSGKQVTLDEGTTQIGIDSNTNKTAISVIQGKIRLKDSSMPASASPLEIGSGSGTVLQNGSVGQLRKIPDPPVLMEPDTALASVIALSTPVHFKWSNTNKTRIEIARTGDFENPVNDLTTASDTASFTLESGDYYFRLTSVDSVGLVSSSVFHAFSIAQVADTKAFKRAPFILFVAAMVLIWLSMLMNTAFQPKHLASWSVQNKNLLFSFVSAPARVFQNVQQWRWLRQFRWLRETNFTVEHTKLITACRYLAALCIMVAIWLLLHRDTPLQY